MLHSLTARRCAGTCAGDVENFCTGIKPGEGRLAACLSKQQTEEEKGNIEGALAALLCSVLLGEGAGAAPDAPALRRQDADR
jgi:hypothetical protein